MSLPERIHERLLVLRCQTGDELAFQEIVQRYQARLGFFLRKMLGSADGAEDALQEVWLDVYRGLSQLRDPAAFPAWIYRIARDRAYRELRRRKGEPVAIAGLEVEAPGEGEAEYSAEDVGRVYQALDRLAAEHREALLLRFIEDMSYEEMAEVLGCPVGTVRSRLHYAKAALRGALTRRGPWTNES